MKNPNKIIAALTVVLFALLGLFIRFSSESSDKSESDTTQQTYVKRNAAASDSLLEKPELDSPQKSATDSKEVASAKTHSQSCSCSGCGVKTVTAPQKERPALQMTEVIQNNLFSKSKNSPISFSLPGGSIATGTVEMTRQENGETVMVQGELTAPQKGQFFFQKQSQPGVAGSMVGVIRFDKGDTAYTVTSDSDGKPELQEKHADEVFCRNYAIRPEEVAAPEHIPADHPSNPPIPVYQNGVVPLSSLMGATAVVYLDFDGAEGPYQTWGGDYTALPANNGNTDVRFVWERVAEDFAPYNINITTDLQVFNNAPENSRIRCIITPTSTAAPGAGGVAYIGSFNWTGDTPCWVFITAGKNCAEAISHEVGHALGLYHDGTSTLDYYGGHSANGPNGVETGWASIMGVGYYENLSQWSQGEYSDANNSQDDLAIIDSSNNNVDFRADDHGDSLATASHLEILSDNSVDSEGIIETRADQDGLKFTVTASSAVSFTVSPVATGPNLDILAEIVDNTGSVVVDDNPTNSLNATVSSTLSAGEYFLRVSGVGKGDPLATGYTDYGSLGFYKVTGTVPNAIKPDRFSIAENPAVATSVGTPTANNNHGGDTLVYSISSGNSSGAFAIDPATGALTVADETQFNFETLSAHYDDPATFELFVDITNATTPALDETVRVVVTVTDVNEAPTVTSPSLVPYLVRPSTNGTSLLTVSGSDPENQLTTYSITAGNGGGEFSIDVNSGEITVASSAAINASSQSSYNLTIQISDGQSPALTDSTDVTIPAFSAPTGYTPGTLTQKYYENITGALLSDLTSDPGFPANPDTTTSPTSFSVGSSGDNFGSTISGVIFVPVTGSYTFWLASDDQGELRLSTDSSAANTTVIATVSSHSSPEQWDKSPSQQSDPVSLQAGQAYYIEARYKEAGGGDHCSVAWSGPGIAQQVISAQFIAPLLPGSDPVASDTSATLSENDTVGTAVVTVSVTDPDAGDTHSYSITAGDTGSAFTIDSNGNITTATSLNHEETSSYNLTVTVSDSTGRFDTATVTITITDEDESAFTGLIAWEDATYNGSIPVGKRTEALAGNATATVDLSAVSGDSSFEFIAEAEDFTQAAVELLRDESWGLNLEAWNNTGVLGMVRFGVQDYSATAETGQSISSPYGSQVHIVYAVDTTAGLTRIYVNGVFVGNVNQLPVIDSATSTLASSSNIRNDSAPGIHAFAAYNSVLSPQDIITRYRAWFGASSLVDADDDDLDDAWELTYYGALSSINETDDTDLDGYTAFEEMVFGMDPTFNDSANAPQQGQIVDDGGTDMMEFKFRRPQNWRDFNVTYQLQTGSTLTNGSAPGDWADESAIPSITTDGTNEWITYLLPLPNSSQTSSFYRCKVTPN